MSVSNVSTRMWPVEDLDIKDAGPFDVWAKSWQPGDDKFKWKRFTDCFFHKTTFYNGNRTKVGAITTRAVTGAPSLIEEGWHPVYVVEIVVPEEAL